MRYLRLAMLLGTLAALFVVPSSASAAITTLQAGEPTLGPEGVTATVPVTINCTTGNYFNVSISLAQSRGKRIALASGGGSAQCTGSDQTLPFPLYVDSGLPFHPGKASLTVSAFSSTGFPYYIFDFETIGPVDVRLTRK